MALDSGDSTVVAELNDRVARWTLMPPSHGEPLQALRVCVSAPGCPRPCRACGGGPAVAACALG